MTPDAEQQLIEQALRVNARYVDEIVIGWNLCPWAARAWRGGAVERRALAGAPPDVAAVLAFVDHLTATPSAAIGLAIFPRAALGEAAWGTFAERARRADQARRPPGAAAPFLMAAFHPYFRDGAGVANAGELVSFVRRTPDPTLQFVRASLIDGLARPGRDVSAEVGRDNFRSVSLRGPADLDRALRDIRADRDTAYARVIGE